MKYRHAWFAPRIRYNNDGEFGQCTGWLITQPYMGHRFWLIGPRWNAVTMPIANAAAGLKALTGWRAAIVRFFGRHLAEHPDWQLYSFNWTVYRLARPTPAGREP